MPEVLQQPLTHEELQGHLMEVQNADPASKAPGYKGDPHHPGSMSYVSHVHLQDTLDRVEAPLTEVVGDDGEHMMTGVASEALRTDMEEVNQYTEAKIKDLESAVAKPADMIRVVNDYRSKDYGKGEKVPKGTLSLDGRIRKADMFDYLDAKQQERADQLRGRGDGNAELLIARDKASTQLLQNLIQIWEYEHPDAQAAWKRGEEPEFWLDRGSDRGSEYNADLFGSLQGRREAFNKLTEQRVRKLGTEVLDAAGIREQRNSDLGVAPTASSVATGRAEEVAKGQELLAGVRVSTRGSTGQTSARERPASRPVQEGTAEQGRNAKLIDAIVEQTKGGTYLHTVKPDGITNPYADVGDGPSSGVGVTWIPSEAITDLQGDKDWHNHPNEAFYFAKSEDGATRRFNYQFKYSRGTLNNANFYIKPAERKPEDLPRYLDRNGGTVGLGVVLPKAMADELEKHIVGDPDAVPPIPPNLALVRKLVDELALKNSKLTENEWKRVRPPYEGLPSKWTMTMITPQAVAPGRRPKYNSERLPVAA